MNVCPSYVCARDQHFIWQDMANSSSVIERATSDRTQPKKGCHAVLTKHAPVFLWPFLSCVFTIIAVALH